MNNWIVHKGRDNTIDTVFVTQDAVGDNQVVAANVFTRFIIDMGVIAFDSDDVGVGLGVAKVFDHSQQTIVNIDNEQVSTRMLRIRLGQQTMTAGRYKAQLIVFDNQHENGLVWADNINIKVNN